MFDHPRNFVINGGQFTIVNNLDPPADHDEGDLNFISFVHREDTIEYHAVKCRRSGRMRRVQVVTGHREIHHARISTLSGEKVFTVCVYRGEDFAKLFGVVNSRLMTAHIYHDALIPMHVAQGECKSPLSTYILEHQMGFCKYWEDLTGQPLPWYAEYSEWFNLGTGQICIRFHRHTLPPRLGLYKQVQSYPTLKVLSFSGCASDAELLNSMAVQDFFDMLTWAPWCSRECLMPQSNNVPFRLVFGAPYVIGDREPTSLLSSLTRLMSFMDEDVHIFSLDWSCGYDKIHPVSMPNGLARLVTPMRIIEQPKRGIVNGFMTLTFPTTDGDWYYWSFRSDGSTALSKSELEDIRPPSLTFRTLLRGLSWKLEDFDIWRDFCERRGLIPWPRTLPSSWNITGQRSCTKNRWRYSGWTSIDTMTVKTTSRAQISREVRKTQRMRRRGAEDDISSERRDCEELELGVSAPQNPESSTESHHDRKRKLHDAEDEDVDVDNTSVHVSASAEAKENDGNERRVRPSKKRRLDI
ncbi:hypothetical protein B0H14DRAFT_2572537 [Mycena olivaceomarginata]|nr:hypothetical protein B0H14DRAFT_2572537 [Mycena olivaceomarginata]